MSLSPSKQRAILALVQYGGVAAAADACGTSRTTLYRWLKDAEFTAALSDASSEQVRASARRLTSLMFRAVDELERLLDSRSEHQRRLAADSILSHGIKLRELSELERRITNLEKRIGVKEHERG